MRTHSFEMQKGSKTQQFVSVRVLCVMCMLVFYVSVCVCSMCITCRLGTCLCVCVCVCVRVCACLCVCVVCVHVHIYVHGVLECMGRDVYGKGHGKGSSYRQLSSHAP